jgi:hypothetical protein
VDGDELGRPMDRMVRIAAIPGIEPLFPAGDAEGADEVGAVPFRLE